MIIRVFANFREICGGKEVTLPISDEQPILSILEQLIQQYPDMNDELFTDDKQLKPLVHVFINGKNIIHLQGLKTVVKSSDQIALFPPVAGG